MPVEEKVSAHLARGGILSLFPEGAMNTAPNPSSLNTFRYGVCVCFLFFFSSSSSSSSSFPKSLHAPVIVGVQFGWLFVSTVVIRITPFFLEQLLLVVVIFSFPFIFSLCAHFHAAFSFTTYNRNKPFIHSPIHPTSSLSPNDRHFQARFERRRPDLELRDVRPPRGLAREGERGGAAGPHWNGAAPCNP